MNQSSNPSPSQPRQYATFLREKLSRVPPTGLSTFSSLPEPMFPHAVALTEWALRRGRAAIFADTGLTKTRMQLAWADVVHRDAGHDVLILAPLAVAEQTVAEGARIGVAVTHAREPEQVRPGLNITNYDRLHKLDPSKFGGVVLDESSIIKHHESKTLQRLLDAFAQTPFKLCATATPAPNDWTELGTHAEFLGICTQQEMLSEFFVHDGGETQKWRLKGHARADFWRWVSQWGAMVRRPSDLGYDDGPFSLPPLSVRAHVVGTNAEAEEGKLFALEARTLSERRKARRASMAQRVGACAEMVNADNQPWVVWCDLNDESTMLTQSIVGAVEIQGKHDADLKEQRLRDFAEGRARVLVSKPSICGWGLNWQHCARIAFVGVTDSWEAYYQAVRRCWRFGQTRPVDVHIFASELEGAIVANLQRKEADALAMSEALSAETRDAVRKSVLGQSRQSNVYDANAIVKAPSWLA